MRKDLCFSPRRHPSIHDRAVVAEDVFVNLAAFVQIPHIAAEHNQPRAVLNDLQALARFGLPDADRAIFGPGEEGLAVGRKGDGVDPIAMPLADAETLPGGAVPYPDGVVV